jgi:tripartite-type tricarboxylate transporter receptor subunit TctC
VNRAVAHGLSRALCALATALPCAAALAQEWPAAPITVVSPVQAGSAGDTSLRLVLAKLSENLKQPVVVENLPGAAGMIGYDRLARAKPDGYTIGGISDSTLTYVPLVQGRKGFNALDALDPVTLLSTSTWVLVSHPSLPVRTVKELAALARARPGQLTYATSGHGTSPHMAAAMFTWLTKTDMIHVPYKGNAPTLTDLLGGQVSMTFGIAHQFLPHVKTGRLRAIAVTTAKRTAFAPQLPTIAEAGLEGYEISAWQGILAPAGTPKEITLRLSSEIGRILRQPDVVERLTAEGAEPVASSPEAFGEYLRAELARWSRIGREAGIRIE